MKSKIEQYSERLKKFVELEKLLQTDISDTQKEVIQKELEELKNEMHTEGFKSE